jgi:hypothetical protein
MTDADVFAVAGQLMAIHGGRAETAWGVAERLLAEHELRDIFLNHLYGRDVDALVAAVDADVMRSARGD